MTRQQPPELFAQRPVRSDFGRYQQRGSRLNMTRVFILLGLLGGAIAIGVAVSTLGGSSSGPEEMPHIKAEGPVKEKPENPGGIDIPHQDVQVFRELDAKSSGPQAAGVEHLLPAPDKPQPVPVAEAVIPQPAATKEVLDSVAPAKIEEVLPVETKAKSFEEALPDAKDMPSTTPNYEAKPVEAVKPAPAAKVEKPAPVVTPKKVEAPKTSLAKAENPKLEQTLARLPKELFTAENPAPVAAASETAPAVKSPEPVRAVAETAAPSSGKSARVQLASLPDEASARQMMQKLSTQHADTLAGASLTIIKAEIAGKGTYYRVMSAPMPEARAKSVCAALASKKAACIVAR